MSCQRQLLTSAGSPVQGMGLQPVGSGCHLSSESVGWGLGTEYVELRLELCPRDKLTQGSGPGRAVEAVTLRMSPREPSIKVSHHPAHVLLIPTSPGSGHAQFSWELLL